MKKTFTDNFDITAAPRNEQFLYLLMRNQRRIYNYILTLVPSRPDADDIWQESVMYMWRKFDSFELGSNFSAWGFQITKYRILKFREKQRGVCIDFSNEIFEKIMSYTESRNDDLDDRLRSLQGCLAKLSDKDRELIQMRYSRNITIKQIAVQSGRSVHTLYKTITRVHTNLQKCVRRTLKAWEVA